MSSSRFISIAGWLCVAAAALAEDPSRAREQADRSLTVAAPKQTAYPLWDGKESVAQYARRVNLPETQTLELGNGVTLELVLIPAGKFIMGTPMPKDVDEGAFRGKIILGQAVLAAGCGILLVLIGFAILRAFRQRHRFQYSLRRFMAMMLAASLCVLGGMHWWYSQRGLEEARAEYSVAMGRFREAIPWKKPVYEVTITKPFYMGKYQVTQEQYRQVMGVNPSYFTCVNLPVETVSWFDAQEFCKKCTAGVSPAADAGGTPVVRLPMEAEWEYACRAGTTTRFYSGNADSALADMAWYVDNAKGRTHPVGLKKPNAWGLFDMYGNVFQWCQDRRVKIEYSNVLNPQVPVEWPYHVLRGGSWLSYPSACCLEDYQFLDDPALRGSPYFGFRVVVARTP